ncbi:MAG: M28 family peptidase [Euryarchaeota archaeon]|nr:M28 family peptidase [Euryarchaeota archaeon]
MLLSILFLSGSLSGCFGNLDNENPDANLNVPDDLNAATATRGQLYTLTVESNVPYTVHRPLGTFFVDELGVFRDAMNMTFDDSIDEVELLVLDTELSSFELMVTAGDEVWNRTLDLVDSDEMMLVDGRRAFDTIDMLTTDYNNRWCASASIHDGGANYEAAAESMKSEWETYGFDYVEVTRYDDDPDQLNVVGYKYGLLYPDQYIVIGGHFDVAYAFTPPGGGTSEGANDDTSGSTVSMEMAQAIASREWDHTVVAALWACEEEGLLGSAAFVAHLPEDKAVKAYMNFDMVSLNYPIIPPSGYGPYDLSIAAAGAHEDNLSIMNEWVGLVVDEELAMHYVDDNRIYWQSAESCASDHCSFFSNDYATFNFFSAGGDASFWQEWHSGTDNLDFMVAKAGGEDELGGGFNTLVWISFSLFVHVDNTGDEWQGRWYSN